MRRILLAAVVLGAALVTAPAPAATVKLVTSQSVFVNAFNPDNSGFFILGGTYNEETVGGPPVTYNSFNVGVFANSQSAFASGPLTVDFDPALQTGTIKGTVGTIVVDVSFFATTISTSSPLYAAIEIVPTPPQQASGQTSLSRQGRINGTVTSPQTGLVNATNGGGNISRFNAVFVTI